MSVFTRFKEPVLKLGVITYVDAVSGRYKIQPIDTEDARINHTTAVAQSVTTHEATAVQTADCYSIGELVLYVDCAAGVWGATMLGSAIIICRVPVMPESIIEAETGTKSVDSPYTEYYNLATRLQDYKPADTDLANNKIGASTKLPGIGGDKVIASDNVGIVLSTDSVSVGGATANILVDGITGSVITNGVLKQDTGVVSDYREHIVNNSALLVNTTKSEVGDGTPTHVSIEGGLVSGRINSTLSDTGVPVSVKEDRDSGLTVVRNANGIIFEQTAAIQTKIPKYTAPLNYDDKVQPAETGTIPLSIIAEDNPNWEIKKPASDITTKLLEPGKPAEPATVKIADKDVELGVGKATFGFLPSGGFIIRDAWGSELRFEDGDIQISAARHIKLLSGDDTVGIFGGVLSLTAISGVNVGASEGAIELVSNQDTHIYSNAEILLNSAHTTISTSNGSDIVSEKGQTTIRSNNIYMESFTEHVITSPDIGIIGDRAVSIVGSGSALVLDTKMVMGGSISIHGDVHTTKNPLKLGKILNRTVTISGYGGSIIAQGSIYGKESVTTDGYMLAAKDICARSIAATQIHPDTGVFTTKDKYVGNFSFPDGTELGSNVQFSVAAEISKQRINDIIDIQLTKLFNLPESTITFTVPRFCGEFANDATIATPIRIDYGKNTKYIYPGESFWLSTGCCELSTSADTVRDEKKLKPTGAINLKLHRKRGNK